MQNTSQQYDLAVSLCKDIFLKKMKDYGTAWRNLRPTSLTDQIFIKAQRIKSIEEKGTQKVVDDIKGEYVGIINYCLIALMQLELVNDNRVDLPYDEVASLYIKYATQTKTLMEDKNHDYGEAWRDMRLSSLTDLILMKIFRVKQIEDNFGKTIISEGVDANYMDMINYSVFALIKLETTQLSKLNS
jgi:Nucleotide modification associated domain 1